MKYFYVQLKLGNLEDWVHGFFYLVSLNGLESLKRNDIDVKNVSFDVGGNS